MLTLADFFCGAGGSSEGAAKVAGVQLKVAANHWKLAVDTHNTNHPYADHICADLSQYDPRYWPKTDLAWFSPSCTHHSGAQGKKRFTQPDMFGDTLPDEAAERSRATMLDVPRFAEFHRYDAIFVENVVEVTKWVLFDSWLRMMLDLGYEHRIVSLNSMHAQLHGMPAPQSRDRVYIVFWRKGSRKPDLERVVRPQAWCQHCGEIVSAMQAFKPGRKVGKYRSQYLYRCPRVSCRNSIVEPGWLPASSIIDWSLPGTRIGDRSRPLAEKTRARIAAGIARYWGPLAVPVEGREGKQAQALSGPLRTQTTRLETGLAVPCGGSWNDKARALSEPLSTRTTRESDRVAMHPFIAELRGGGSTARSTTEPLATVTASGNHHGLVMPYYGNATVSETSDPLSTVTTVDRHALLMRNNTQRGDDQSSMTTPIGEPARTITTTGHQSLLTGGSIDVDDVLFRMLEPSEVKQAMAFPSDYVMLGNRREQVKLSGNAVTPPAARDLIATVAEALS